MEICPYCGADRAQGEHGVLVLNDGTYPSFEFLCRVPVRVVQPEYAGRLTDGCWYPAKVASGRERSAE